MQSVSQLTSFCFPSQQFYNRTAQFTEELFYCRLQSGWWVLPCHCITNRGKLSWWPKNGMVEEVVKDQSEALSCNTPVNAVHLLISISYLRIRHLRKYLVISHGGFASPVGMTPLQLVILSLGKLGVECEENWASSSPCTEHLGPGELAVSRQLFVIFPSGSTFPLIIYIITAHILRNVLLSFPHFN